MTAEKAKYEPIKSVSWLQHAKQRWEAARPKVYALAVGLVAGPLISSLAGWQITSRTADAQLKTGLIEQQAAFCQARAHAEVRDTSKLDWDGRQKLAAKWAVMPGAKAADAEVVSACAWKLI